MEAITSAPQKPYHTHSYKRALIRLGVNIRLQPQKSIQICLKETIYLR